MIGTRLEECTPVPEHVSVDNSNDSSSAPSLSPVTLESSPTAKKLLFREEMTEESAEIQCCIPRKVVRTSEIDAEVFIQRKMEDILCCLGGVPITDMTSRRTVRSSSAVPDAKVVDLWHLRQLALTRGGLLNANIRKQAWLKLLHANEDVLMPSLKMATIQGENKSSNGLQFQNIQLSDNEISMIKLDIKRCIWNIEAEIKRSKMSQSMDGKAKHGSTGDVTSLASFESASGQLSPSLPPEAVSTFPSCDDSNTEASKDNDTPLASVSTPKSGTVTPRYSRRKREERSLLLNIITSVLRSNPEEVKELGMERFFYFPGMHNVVAPILITLESPSLTSLVIKRLSQYHLKYSMVSTFMDIQSTIRAMLMPLLEHVDKPLHDIIIQSDANDPCAFALRWVLCWFASDIPDYEVIARLFDVFLVGHYTLPIYVSVAILTSASNRSKIMVAAQNDNMYLPDVLSSLPAKMVSNQSQREVVDSFECVIETSLSYIKQTPPTQLIHLAQKSTDEIVASSIKLSKKGLTRYRPLWTCKSAASTDWELIQEARRSRDLSPKSRATDHTNRQAKFNAIEKRCFLDPTNDLAVEASGADDHLEEMILRAYRHKRNRIVLALFCFIAVSSWILLIYYHDVLIGSNTAPSPAVKRFRSSSRRSGKPLVDAFKKRFIKETTEADLLKTQTNEKHIVRGEKVEADLSIHETIVSNILHTNRVSEKKPSHCIGDLQSERTSKRIPLKELSSNARAYVKEDPDLFIIMI